MGGRRRFQKPLRQCTVAIAVHTTAALRNLPSGVASPPAGRKPPQSSAVPARFPPVRLQALAALAAGDLRMSEREARLGLAVSTVTRLVDRPEAAGLVERRSQRPDRRSCSSG